MPQPQPRYTAGELASNTIAIAGAVLRGGRLTDKARRRIERNARAARDRGANQ
jgi:hypothetical protein